MSITLNAKRKRRLMMVSLLVVGVGIAAALAQSQAEAAAQGETSAAAPAGPPLTAGEKDGLRHLERATTLEPGNAVMLAEAASVAFGVGMSARAHARVTAIDLGPVLAAPGVVDTYVAADIPGVNNCGPIIADEAILAADLVEYVGQPLFVVAADTVDRARKAARLASIDYEELEPILDPLTAVEKQSFVLPSETIERGNAAVAVANAPHRLQRRVNLGSQNQFYLEGHVAMAVPGEDGQLHVHSSTQHPDEVQHLVAEATGRKSKDVVCTCRRMGGAFGGKESQAATIACIAALMAVKTGRPCKLRLDRDDDMIITGNRHDFVIDYDVGFDESGLILGIDFMFASRCGISADLSGPVNDRTMFHCDNAYFLENVRIVSHRCKTNTVSNTAFRGFGGPQGMFAIENAIDDIARALESGDEIVVRYNYLYGYPEFVDLSPGSERPGVVSRYEIRDFEVVRSDGSVRPLVIAEEVSVPSIGSTTKRPLPE